MAEPWYHSQPRLLEEIQQEVAAVQPQLQWIFAEEDLRVVGTYCVNKDGQILERFAIRYSVNKSNPCGLPIVWETAGRIPRVTDPHHVNAHDGSLCVILPEAYWYHYPRGLSVADFMESPLRAHLSGQVLVLRGKQWPAGEWGHGPNGPFQFYAGLLGTGDPRAVLELVKMLAGPVVKGHWSCPCGSQLIIRHCHRELIWDLRAKIPTEVAERGYALLTNAIRKQ